MSRAKDAGSAGGARINLPWGADGRLPLDWPAHWPAPRVGEPRLEEPLADYPAALAEALDRPEGNLRLGTLVGPGATVAIVVDDPSRWTPVREALPVVLERLHAAGVARDAVTISLGVGRHAAADESALRARVGDAVFDAYPCYSPPVDDLGQYVDLGITPQGVPVRVFRPVATASVRVLIGSVLPHLQAGFGGGYKLIFPGCSHRSTLGALHRQGLGGSGPGGGGPTDAARLLGGDVRSNPMRQAIRSAAALLPGPCLSISHVLGPPGTVFRVRAGAVEAVQEVLVEEARRRSAIEAGDPPADVVVAGNFPWPGDPMQSFKVLLNHRAAGVPGGALVGFFWTDPAEIDRSFPLPALRAIAATGAVGGWVVRRGLRLADRIVSATESPSKFMLRWARELVADRSVHVYAPPLRQRLGPRLGPVRLHDDVADLWRGVERSLGRVPRAGHVFPSGGLTYCPQPQQPPWGG